MHSLIYEWEHFSAPIPSTASPSAAQRHPDSTPLRLASFEVGFR